MKSRTGISISIGILSLAISSTLTLASAQYLDDQQYGALPACTSNCPELTGAQSQCGSNDWSCFCSAVWTQIQAAPAQICATTCTAADQPIAYQWYNSNCGADNGASAHPAGSTGNTGGNSNPNGGSGGSGTGSSSPSQSSGSTSSSGSSSSSDDEPQSWWAGHYQWVVMVIVLFFGLLGLALLGLWLKKRHYRKRDQISGGFNQGITERSAGGAPPMSSNPAVHNPHDASILSTTEVNSNGGRDSPVRTRDAFMPYGYGYTRSESRLGSYPGNGTERAASPLARGQTPVGEIERGVPVGGEETTPAQKKSRRVLVRERSGADSSEDVSRRERM